MTPKDWKEYEWTSTPEKWIRLYKELEIEPGLERGRAPLQDFVRLYDLRSDLMHYKHGANVVESEQWVPVRSPAKQHIDLDMSGLDDAKRVTLQAFESRERLQPILAAGYYRSVRDLLVGALARQPEDEFNVVAKLKWKTGEGHTAPDIAELLKPALP